jgi:hypothetical protein
MSEEDEELDEELEGLKAQLNEERKRHDGEKPPESGVEGEFEALKKELKTTDSEKEPETPLPSDDDPDVQELKKELEREKQQQKIKQETKTGVDDFINPTESEAQSLKDQIKAEREKHGLEEYPSQKTPEAAESPKSGEEAPAETKPPDTGDTSEPPPQESFVDEDTLIEKLNPEAGHPETEAKKTDASEKEPSPKPGDDDGITEIKKAMEKREKPYSTQPSPSQSPEKTKPQAFNWGTPTDKPDQKASEPDDKPPKPALEELGSDDFTGEAIEQAIHSKPPKEGKSRFPLLAAIIILTLAAAGIIAAVQFLPLITQPKIQYQCWDQSIVEDLSLCPKPTTTTTTSTTTTTLYVPKTTTTTSTSTTLEIACHTNADCVREIPYFPFCEGKYVKNQDIIYLCIRPGTPESYCRARQTTPKIIQACEDWGYCHLGACYPTHCQNKKRDYQLGEEKIDCGGPCRPCESSEPVCSANTDCGVDRCGTPYCNSQGNPATNCTRHVCVNPGTSQAQCTIESKIEVLEVCDRWHICIEGNNNCLWSREGVSCHDCIQNQGEQRMDCGGPCPPCAIIPPTYDTLNLTALDTLEYQGYKFRLERLIREIQCTRGAHIRVEDPYGKSQSKKITIYENAQYFDVDFGMLSADTSSIKIWVTRKTRT